MADLLSIGMSGLLAYRRALDTAGHNIANANTAGYSRQRVELAARPGAGSGSGYVGTGVDVATVRRLGDDLISARLQTDASAYARLQTYHGFASRVDSLLSDADAGLSRPLQGFFDAANALSQTPSSTAARQNLIGAADTLAARMRETQAQLDGMAGEIHTRMRATVDEVNELSGALADLNREIVQAYGSFGGQPPNDLLDRRDQLLQELSARVGISTSAQADGSVNVYVGGGQALVLGPRSTALGVAADVYDSGRLDIVHAGGARITAQLGGGVLGGLLDARRELLDPARARLGRIAAGLTEAVNTQHAQGFDANGIAGGDFFAPLRGAAFAATANTGTAQIEVSFGDPGALGEGDYELRFDGSAWSLSDLRSGQSVALTGSGAPGDPLVGAGLELQIGGSASAGDRFLIRPTVSAAAGMAVALDDPARLAAAATTASGDNGNARALADLASGGVFNGGTQSVLAAHAALVSSAGARAQQAAMQLDAQAAIGQQTRAQRESVSGVNLDEEAADLIRYQQAYQAAARVVQVADTLFQTLLQAAAR
ncbi:flagellar hook-associated protein FlgK [Sinimarinibacterium thermocellulolyticum]|uniref:Flagellar hook-associated protein 1 n=1 Tax=Sinimarinibacterium thermocellulolyticum TaxID=3170016 RepID=A0ABV2AA44_9GAMM